MPWTNQGGGGGGPWGGGGGGGQSPWGRGTGGRGQPPNIEEMLRRGQDKVKTLLPGGLGGGRALILLGIAIVVIWLATGFYRVDPNEQGVELVFGKWVGTTGPGLNYNWPAPIGQVLRPAVTTANRLEVGFRAFSGIGGSSTDARDVPEESLMLTGDENIIDVHAVVIWKVQTKPQKVKRVVIVDGKPVETEVEASGVYEYLFNIRRPELTVKNVAEAALREIIGKSEFEFARTQGRGKIAAEAEKLIQRILDDYGAGILIQSVQLQRIEPPANVLDAFLDVQAASADQQRAINEATAYLNEVVQKAQGEAEQIVRAAEAYREEHIARATGEASRFLAVYAQYKNEKDVTKRRIYLDTMKDIMARIDKVLIDSRGGVLPYLPLQPLTPPRGAGTTPATQGAGGQ